MLRQSGTKRATTKQSLLKSKTRTLKSNKKRPNTVTKRHFKGAEGYVEPKAHKPQAPDLLSRSPQWERKALDEDPYPRPDVDGFLSEIEASVTPAITNDDMTALMEQTYERSPLDVRFDNFRKLTELCGIPRHDLGHTQLHIGLQHTLRQLRTEATSDYHFNLSLEASHRCMDPKLYQETLDVFKAKGFKPELRHLTPLIHMATFRRDPATFKSIMNVIGTDMGNWDQAVAENVIMFHEMHQHWDEADKIFAQAVAKKLIPIPWKHQYQSHINATKFAQLVPSKNPKWDEKTPTADIIHFDGSPTLLSRVKMRYACYSMQDLCENNGTVHPKINIPHNIVVQTVVRGKNAPGDHNMYHKLWQPVQQEIKDYMVKFGIQTNYIARAANLFWIDHMYFDRLPTPGNQNPQKKPEYRPFKTEGRRALEIKFAAEEEARLTARMTRQLEITGEGQPKAEATTM